jgi:hypothetical protein
VETIPTDELIVIIAHFLHEATKVDRSFPCKEIRLPRIKELVGEIKIAAAFHTPGEKAALTKFLEERMARGRDVTIEELHQSYSEFCQANLFPAFPRTVFERLIPGVVKEAFGPVRKSHDIQRADSDGALRARRGFHGLSLKARPDVPDATDAPDVPDAAPKKTDQAVSSSSERSDKNP